MGRGNVVGSKATDLRCLPSCAQMAKVELTPLLQDAMSRLPTGTTLPEVGSTPAHLSVVLLLALFFFSKVALGQDVCPSKNESSLKKVRSFLSDSAWAQEREDLGIAVSTDRVRALSDEQDTAACRHLAETFDIETENLVRPFYKAGPYYFVVSLRRVSCQRTAWRRYIRRPDRVHSLRQGVGGCSVLHVASGATSCCYG